MKWKEDPWLCKTKEAAWFQLLMQGCVPTTKEYKIISIDFKGTSLKFKVPNHLVFGEGDDDD